MLKKLLLTLLVAGSLNEVLARAVPRQVRKGRDFADHIPLEKRSILPRDTQIAPKVFIISMFAPEQNVWLAPLNLTTNVTVTGFSPLFPNAHCASDYDICQLTTGEAEINAASTITALYLSPLFQLSKTYFLIAGIAGVNPHQGTTGTAAFARFAIQAALEYELDSREIPANWTSGYWPQGTGGPNNYPLSIYGTEAFELNIALRDKAIALASNVTLNDSASAASYRAMYGYAPATEAPKVIAGDSVCADVYYSGAHICEYFGNYTQLITNGSGVYAMAAQEDNATLEALLRGALAGLIDFARIVLLRTASDFDRAPPGIDEVYHLTKAPQGGFQPALKNILLAGRPFVDDVVNNWDSYEPGILAPNYLGDIFGSLSYLYGPADFGTSANTIGGTTTA